MAELLKIAEAADEMNVSVPSARRALLEAKVTFVKIDRASYIKRIDFDLFLASRKGYAGRGRPKKTKAEQPSKTGISDRNILSNTIPKLAALTGQDEDVVARIMIHEAAHAVMLHFMAEGNLSSEEIEGLLPTLGSTSQVGSENGEGTTGQQKISEGYETKHQTTSETQEEAIGKT